MKMRTQDAPAIQVDMVPLIDIITLVLMFLVVVGGLSGASEAVKVNLPRADQAKPEKELPITMEGRITISLQNFNGVYDSVIGGNRYSIGSRGGESLSALSTYLLKSAEYMHRRGMCKQHDDGTYAIPVKLRVGEDVPMKTVEDVLDSVVQARMRDVQYAANPNPPIE